MDRYDYRVEQTTVDRTAAPAALAGLLNESEGDWELFSVDHLRDDGANTVFLLIWRQARPFGDLAE